MNILEASKRRMIRMRCMWFLEEARWDYWNNSMNDVYEKLKILDKYVINEPPLDSKEYADGERKSSTPDDEQEEEEFIDSGEDDGETTVYGERDEAGYLVR